MIKKIKIVNFASCKEVVLDNLGPMTVLVGRNGTGKTNVLKAIEWAVRCARATTPNPFFELSVKARMDEPTVAKLDLETDGKRYFYSLNSNPGTGIEAENLDIVVNGEERRNVMTRAGETVTLMDLDHPLRIARYLPCLAAMRSLLPTDQPVIGLIDPFLTFLNGIRYDPFDEPPEINRPMSIVGEQEYRQWIGLRNSSSSEVDGRELRLGPDRDLEDSVLFNLIEMKENYNDEFEELKSLLGSNGIGLLDDIEINLLETPVEKSVNGSGQSDSRLYFLRFSPSKSPGKRFMHRVLSLGTRRILRILVSMLHSRNSVTLGEQIEDGIHPGLLKKVISLLRTYSDPNQFILTTHSSTVVDVLRPEEVRLVSMKNGETKVHALTAKERRVAKTYLKEQGTLAEAIALIEED